MFSTRSLSLSLTLFALCLAMAWPAAAASDGFNPTRIQSLAAIVTEVNVVPTSPKNDYMGPGVELGVATATETLSVPLGPKWFADRQGVQPAVGDQLTLVGMRPDPAQPVFLVSQIKKGQVSSNWRTNKGDLIWKTTDAGKFKLPPPSKKPNRPPKTRVPH